MKVKTDVVLVIFWRCADTGAEVTLCEHRCKEGATATGLTGLNGRSWHTVTSKRQGSQHLITGLITESWGKVPTLQQAQHVNQ